MTTRATAGAAILAMREEREGRGWTLEDLARRAGVDAEYLGRVERGQRTPSSYFVANLARALAED